jgi:hypothetical protein
MRKNSLCRCGSQACVEGTACRAPPHDPAGCRHGSGKWQGDRGSGGAKLVSARESPTRPEIGVLGRGIRRKAARALPAAPGPPRDHAGCLHGPGKRRGDRGGGGAGGLSVIGGGRWPSAAWRRQFSIGPGSRGR